MKVAHISENLTANGHELKALIMGLEGIIEGKYGIEEDYGLCRNLQKIVLINWGLGFPAHQVVECLCKDWEHFSGNVMYPIPSPDLDISSSEYYHYHSPKWEGKAKYLRLSLAVHLLTKLKNLLESIQ